MPRYPNRRPYDPGFAPRGMSPAENDKWYESKYYEIQKSINTAQREVHLHQCDLSKGMTNITAGDMVFYSGDPSRNATQVATMEKRQEQIYHEMCERRGRDVNKPKRWLGLEDGLCHGYKKDGKWVSLSFYEALKKEITEWLYI